MCVPVIIFYHLILYLLQNVRTDVILSNAYSLLNDVSLFVNMVSYMDICILNQPQTPFGHEFIVHLVRIVASIFKRYWPIIFFSCLVLVAGQCGLQNVCGEFLVITFLFCIKLVLICFNIGQDLPVKNRSIGLDLFLEGRY